MRAYYDFVSGETGRTLLHASLDAAPEGLTREDSWKVVQILRRTRKELEKVYGRPVRMSVDSWEGTLFWYLVLFRPLEFDARHPVYSGKRWTVYDLIKQGAADEDLKMTDLGVFADRENMWVVLNWPEAKDGVCADFDTCLSWKKVMAEYKKRTGRKADSDYMEKCARSFSYVIPTWELERIGYTKKAFFKDSEHARDFIALDITGIDIPRLNVDTDKVELPAAKRARFAHFYTEDEREYAAIRKYERELHKKNSDDGRRVVQRARRKDLQKKEREKKRELEKKKKDVLYRITRAIYKIPRILGGANPVGRSSVYLTVKTSEELFMALVTAFINGEYPAPKWGKLQDQVELIENLLALEDPHVPDELWKWTWWKNKAERVRMEYEGE